MTSPITPAATHAAADRCRNSTGSEHCTVSMLNGNVENRWWNLDNLDHVDERERHRGRDRRTRKPKCRHQDDAQDHVERRNRRVVTHREIWASHMLMTCPSGPAAVLMSWPMARITSASAPAV